MVLSPDDDGVVFKLDGSVAHSTDVSFLSSLRLRESWGQNLVIKANNLKVSSPK